MQQREKDTQRRDSAGVRLKTEVDLSYKDEAFRVYYDIESLPSLFTVTFLHDRAATLWFYGSKAYDHVDDEHLREAFASYLSESKHLQSLGIEDPSAIDINLLRVREDNRDSFRRLRVNLEKFEVCYPIESDYAYVGDDRKHFVEYVGWNSSSYDLPMMLYIELLIQSQGVRVKPSDIRRLSDWVVEYDGRASKLSEYMEQKLVGRGIVIPAATYRTHYNYAMWYDGHIDIAKMLRSSDENSEQRFPPGLKKEEAKLGMDIVADEAVSDSSANAVLDDTRLVEFVKYNLHDVAATKIVGETQDVVNKIYVRDIVRKMFPWTSARAVPVEKLKYWTPPERDITEAQLTARALVGAERSKPVDYEVVSYEFPVPDGHGGFVQVDLLDYMRKVEEFMPADLYTFFDHWRGNSTKTWAELYALKSRQPLTKDTAANIPYYRKDKGGSYKPIDAYIRISTGGAHGACFAGLSDFSDAEVATWTRSNAKPKPEATPTLDLKDVVHADFTSYYPYLLTKMKAFILEDGDDRYSEIYDLRVRIKDELSKHHDKTKWGAAERDMSDQQLGLKLQLNAASGAAGMHSEYALLPLDNKILSMRLIGNMSIWCLAQRMVHAGAYILSTNTDGIYVTEISLDEASKVIEGFERDYGILVDPEMVDRFINRDVSNRLELIEGDGGTWKVNDARGRLRSATKLVYDDTEHGHNVNYPLAVGNAAVRYMVDDEEWLTKPYDRGRMLDILEDIRSKSDAMAWVQIYGGTSVRRLLVNGEMQQKICRVALTKDGHPLAQDVLRKLSRSECFDVWSAIYGKLGQTDAKGVVGEDATLGEAGRVAGIVLADQSLSVEAGTLVLARKEKGKGRRDPDILRAVACPKEPMTFEQFTEAWRAGEATCLAYVERNRYVELQSWHESQLTGYPVPSMGCVLNDADELHSFDLSRLDMRAYLSWAEDILKVWRVAATLEDGKLTTVAYDDELTPAKLKMTKRELAELSVEQLYVDAIRRMREETER